MRSDTPLRLRAEVPSALRGGRLDKVAAELFPDYSRASLQVWIREGSLLVDDCQAGVRDKLIGGEQLTLTVAPRDHDQWTAEALCFDRVHEDDALIVVNKPVGLVVHPGAGNVDGTLLNGLLHHCPALATVPRAGIVHRLDKDTSGLLVVAKTLAAHYSLVKQLKARTVSRVYRAVVVGHPDAVGTVDRAIGRHPVVRTRMAVARAGLSDDDVPRGYREARTHYRVLEKYCGTSLVEARLETGRTHQIRVHMNAIGHPLVGDPVYGARRMGGGTERELVEGFSRQALHATRLSFRHPDTGREVVFEAPPPADMQALIDGLAACADADVD